MKAIRNIVIAGLAVLATASCDKTPVSDAVANFESDSYVFYLEEGPNFSVPVNVTGSNVVYPVTVKIVDVPSDDENTYSERNSDYRFLERELVVNSADEKPEFTVRVINSNASILDIALQIETVSNGEVGSLNKTEILIAPEVAFYTGTFTATGTTSKGEAYSENWDFVYGADSAIGFWGLYGETEKEGAKYPVTGTMVKEEGETYFAFPLGFNNYVGAYYFNLPAGKTACYVAPIVISGNSAYTSGDLYFQVTDRDNFVVGLGEGQYLTYGLFGTDQRFLGYTYGEAVKFTSVTRADDTKAQAAAACASKTAASGLTVSDVKGNVELSKVEIASDPVLSR